MYTASAKIKSVDEKILANLVAHLKNQPEVSIIIDAHTDSVASDKMNLVEPLQTLGMKKRFPQT